jgi:hypothetical protein
MKNLTVHARGRREANETAMDISLLLRETGPSLFMVEKDPEKCGVYFISQKNQAESLTGDGTLKERIIATLNLHMKRGKIISYSWIET